MNFALLIMLLSDVSTRVISPCPAVGLSTERAVGFENWVSLDGYRKPTSNRLYGIGFSYGNPQKRFDVAPDSTTHSLGKARISFEFGRDQDVWVTCLYGSNERGFAVTRQFGKLESCELTYLGKGFGHLESATCRYQNPERKEK
ncbi:STY0301 family protein [Arenimonas sp.]|uniref:STY0301 family protein n=1 Tax=Arenimonas sp. TaxID=1872635 RepID=UPI0039C85F96